MFLNYIFVAYPVLFFVPAAVYLILVRPKFDRSALWVYITGALMAVSTVLPIAGMSSVILLIVWIFAVGALLAVSAILWIVGAVKKNQHFMAGPIMAGITVLCSGALIGNWLALITAIVYLSMLLRYRLDYSFE